MFFFFFFNDTATTEIYTLSLHDALPIYKNDSPGMTPTRDKLADYIFPKTGGTNPDLSPERFVPAGYLKEAYGYMGSPEDLLHGKYTGDPYSVVKGKVSPLFAGAAQLASGKNYYDQPYRDPSDEIW